MFVRKSSNPSSFEEYSALLQVRCKSKGRDVTLFLGFFLFSIAFIIVNHLVWSSAGEPTPSMIVIFGYIFSFVSFMNLIISMMAWYRLSSIQEVLDVLQRYGDKKWRENVLPGVEQPVAVQKQTGN
jgi:hypothetical protein